MRVTAMLDEHNKMKNPFLRLSGGGRREVVFGLSVGHISFNFFLPQFPGHSLMPAALSKDWLPFSRSWALLEHFVLHLAFLQMEIERIKWLLITILVLKRNCQINIKV